MNVGENDNTLLHLVIIVKYFHRLFFSNLNVKTSSPLKAVFVTVVRVVPDDDA